MAAQENQHAEEEQIEVIDSVDPVSPELHGQLPRDLPWVFAGEHGLRAGWSVAIFVGMYYLLLAVVDAIVLSAYPGLANGPLSPVNFLIGESLPFFVILCSTLFMARVEHRSLWDYNLTGNHRLRRFGAGFATGFGALSVLVMALAAGGWLSFGRVALN